MAKIQVEDFDKNDVIVASFANTSKLSKDINFSTFTSKRKSQPTFIQGETDSLIFQAQKIDDQCDYYIGVESNDEMHVLPVTFVEGKSKVKRLITHDVELEHDSKRARLDTKLDYQNKRNELGGLFGTKRAKKAILDATKNKVDSELVNQEEQDQIIKNISESTSLMPSKTEMFEEADREARILPLAHEDATHVEEIYPLEDLVYQETLDSFRVDSMIGQSDEEILKMLPFKHEQSNLISKLLQLATKSKSSLQLLCYFSTLIGFYTNRRVRKLEDLQSKYQIQPSPSTIKSIVTEFAIKFGVNGNRSIQLDSKQEDKLLAHIIVILLHLLQFQLELAPLASELSLKPMKLLALVRSIGCNVRTVNLTEAKEMNIPKSKISSYKIGELKVPFKLPQITRQRAGGNGGKR